MTTPEFHETLYCHPERLSRVGGRLASMMVTHGGLKMEFRQVVEGDPLRNGVSSRLLYQEVRTYPAFPGVESVRYLTPAEYEGRFLGCGKPKRRRSR